MKKYHAEHNTNGAATQELLIIDPDVKDVEILLAELSPNICVAHLNKCHDPLLQIAQALVSYGRVKTVHILAHGSPGLVHLGGVDVDEAYLQAHKGLLRAIEALLGNDARIALWACSVSWTPKGQSFIRAFADGTGAYVYGTDQPVGAAALGGSWDIGIPAPFALKALKTYPHALTPDGSLTDVVSSVTVNEGDTTLLDSDVSFTYSDFEGGEISVSGLLSGDVVSVLNVGSGTGEVGLAGSAVSFEGVVVGTASGGEGATFSIALNSEATQEAVEAIVEALTLTVTADEPETSRTLKLDITDVDGKSATVEPTVTQRTGADNPLYDASTHDSNTAPAMVDIDGDNDLDVVIGYGSGSSGLRVWQNDGSGGFTALTGTDNPFNGLDFGDRAAPAFADIDNDGDADAFIGLYDGNIAFYENTGSSTFVERTGTDNPFDGIDVGQSAEIAFGDIDGDGDLDVFSGRGDGSFAYYENTGTKSAAIFSEVVGAGNPLNGINPGYNSSIELIDMDEDSDLDAVIGGQSGNLHYYENTGNADSVNFTERTGDENPFGDVSVNYYSKAALGDIDGDGAFELVVGSYSEADPFTYEFSSGLPIAVTVNPVNDPAVVTGDIARAVWEGSNGTSGSLYSSDPDGNAYFQADTLAGSYGDFTVNVFGSWSYTLNNDNDTIDQLTTDETLTDAFTVRTSDGTEKTVEVTINGVNDAATIGGTLSANLDENADNIGGTATVSDLDGAASFNADTSHSAYGDFEIAENGDWTFDLNNDFSPIDSMQEGESLELNYTIYAADGTSEVITVNVLGANDDSVITGSTTGSIFESADSTERYLSVHDVDNDVTFVADVIDGGYGVLTIQSNGLWSYELDNNNNAVDGLTAGDTLSENFTVYTNDGNSAEVEVTINGVNDLAVFHGDTSVYLNEDVDSFSGSLTVSDVDGEDSFLAETLEGDFGTITITENGDWTFDLNNDLDAVAGLGEYDTLGGNIHVHAADGTAQEISILVTGVNDDPIFSNVADDYIFTEDTLARLDLSGITLADVDEGDIQTLTIEVSDGTFGIADGDVGDDALVTVVDWQTVRVVGTAESITSYLETGGNLTYKGAENAWGDNAATLTITVDDGHVSVSESANIDIEAVDDSPVVSGDFTGALEEGDEGDAPATVTGTLVISDVDSETDPEFPDQAATEGDNGYGSFELAGGTWTYRLDQSAVQGLGGGEIVSDTTTFVASDGTNQLTTITITGTEDDAVISGTFTGSLSEQAGTPDVVNGTITISDPDADDTPTFMDQVATPGDNGYGSFELSKGVWTYTLDRSAIDGLGSVDTLEDTITFTASDGSTQQITVTIRGSDDAPSPPELNSSGVNEDEKGAFVGILSSTDPEGQAVSFVVEDDRFQVVGNRLYLADDVSLDYEEIQSLSIKVTASDGGRGRSAFVKITVNDLPEGIANTPSDSSDVVVGGDGSDTLTGGAGDDTLDGGAGNDIIIKGDEDQGQDIIVGGEGGDMIRSGGGNDFVIGDGASDGATQQSLAQNGDTSTNGEDTIIGGDGDDTVLGGSWDDDLVDDNGRYDDGEAVEAGTAPNHIWVGAGNDIAVGSGGNDQVGGSTDNDSLSGLGGNDTLYGNFGDDVLSGGNGDDLLFNGKGSDVVDGGAGDDSIYAGAGDDQLTGGAGADTFIFGAASGNDVVTDFSVDEDTLDLAARGFGSLDEVAAATTESNQGGIDGILIDLGNGESAFLASLSLTDMASVQLTLT